jgi:hypothetical protein
MCPVSVLAVPWEEPSVILSEADTLLAPVAQIEGCVLACLVDASTGTTLAARQEDGEIGLPAAAAGAADIAQVLSLLTAELAAEPFEDVMVTFPEHFHVVRLVSPEGQSPMVLLVVLDRVRANLAMARREIRNFCAGLAG